MSDSGVPDDQAAEADGQKWYTVEEAGTYLGVSRPTVFRWMKDGTLSFYKVGGSTRFSQEGLDAVFEKTTGRKEAEAVAGRCAACGHTMLMDGRLQGTGRLYFRPDETRFWTLQQSMVDLRARVCPACGFVQLNVNVDQLKRLERKREDG